MAVTAYYAQELTGGGANALDLIDGAALLEGDMAYVFTGSVSYSYKLDDDSAATERSPWIINPDANGGNKRWILQSSDGIINNDGAVGEETTTLPAGITGLKGHFVVTDAQYLKIVAVNGEKFRYLATQGAANGYIRSNTVGDTVTIVFSADDWVITDITGTWLYDE